MDIKLLMHKVPLASNGEPLAVRGSVFFLIHDEAENIIPNISASKKAKIASVVSRALFLNRPPRSI